MFDVDLNILLNANSSFISGVAVSTLIVIDSESDSIISVPTNLVRINFITIERTSVSIFARGEFNTIKLCPEMYNEMIFRFIDSTESVFLILISGYVDDSSCLVSEESVIELFGLFTICIESPFFRFSLSIHFFGSEIT